MKGDDVVVDVLFHTSIWILLLVVCNKTAAFEGYDIFNTKVAAFIGGLAGVLTLVASVVIDKTMDFIVKRLCKNIVVDESAYH